MLVEVKAGDDFEFANARTALYPPHALGTPIFQSGRVLSNTTADVSEMTIGESVQSLKQLISIPKVTVAGLGVGRNYYNVAPWFYQPRPSVLTPAPTAHLFESFGFGGMVASCYAFVRGGTDFHAYPCQDSSSAFFATVREVPAFEGRSSSAQQPGNQPFSNAPLVVNTQGPLHVRLPAYQHLIRYFSSVLNSTVGTGSAWSFNDVKTPTLSFDSFGFPTVFVCAINSPAAVTAFLSRNAADDAMAGGFLGPPPLLLLSTNTAATAYDRDSTTF